MQQPEVQLRVGTDERGRLEAEKKRVELARAWFAGLLTIEEAHHLIIDERLRDKPGCEPIHEKRRETGENQNCQ